MGECYCGMAPNAPDVCANGPAGWNPLWSFPGPPWAPGWPIGIEPGYSLNLTLGAVTLGAAANLIASVLFNGLDDSTLQCHNLQITALINGATLQVSNDGVTYVNSLNSNVKNYTGSKYGFNKNLYLNLTNANLGQSGSITVTNTSTNPTFSATVNFTVAVNAVLVALSSDGTHQAQISGDGMNWVAESVAAVAIFESICWADTLGLFVAVGANSVQTSPDGITWTAQMPAASNTWRSVCWSHAKTLLVAVSDDGGTSQVMTSPDGITWTLRSVPASQTFRSVTWSHDLSIFVAVAVDGNKNPTISSSDGVVWTHGASIVSTQPWISVVWASSLSKFVAVNDNGTKSMTSTDGLNWTVATGVPSGLYNSLTWSGSILVAVGSSGAVATSTDGISWTSRTAAESNTWNSVVYSTSLGLFVAVASDGVHRVMTSPDGITWTAQSGAEQNSLVAVCAKS